MRLKGITSGAFERISEITKEKVRERESWEDYFYDDDKNMIIIDSRGDYWDEYGNSRNDLKWSDQTLDKYFDKTWNVFVNAAVEAFKEVPDDELEDVIYQFGDMDQDVVSEAFEMSDKGPLTNELPGDTYFDKVWNHILKSGIKFLRGELPLGMKEFIVDRFGDMDQDVVSEALDKV